MTRPGYRRQARSTTEPKRQIISMMVKGVYFELHALKSGKPSAEYVEKILRRRYPNREPFHADVVRYVVREFDPDHRRKARARRNERRYTLADLERCEGLSIRESAELLGCSESMVSKLRRERKAQRVIARRATFRVVQ